MTAVGDARVFTAEQNAALRHDALTRAGCTRMFTDVASGARIYARLSTAAQAVGGTAGRRPVEAGKD